MAEKRINVRKILSAPPKPLTKSERERRVSFYADNPNVQATPVEGAHNFGPARG